LKSEPITTGRFAWLRPPGKIEKVNRLARLSNKNARITALYLHWTQKQGSGLAWPKADQIALYCVALVLALMLCAYAVPESEATVYLRTQVAVWGNLALFASAGILAVCVMIHNAGKGLKIEFAAAPELPEGETRQFLPEAGETGETGDWTYTGKMSPLLSPMDKLRISQSTNPKLNEETAGKIKACLAAGLTTAETSREAGLSIDTVKKYAALIRKGFDSPALSVEL